MSKWFVRVDIVDSNANWEEGKVMDTCILVNPNMGKLQVLQKMIDDGEFEDFSEMFDYITENFEVLNMTDFIEIEW